MIQFMNVYTSMADVWAYDVSAKFLFAGDFKWHHQAWLCSTTTKFNRHEVAAYDVASVIDCHKLVCCPTHTHSGTPTDDCGSVLVWVAVAAPLDNSNH